MSITVHDGAAADLDEVMAVMDEAFDPAFGEAWTRPQCLGMLALPGTFLVLARSDGEPAGFALVRTILDEAELLLLAVRPALWRRGVASRLIEAVDAASARRAAHRLHLEMRDGNAALALYLSHGFAAVGRRPGYYRLDGGGLADAVTLVRRLTSND